MLNYNPVGVSTSTAGHDFGALAAALFTKPSDNKEDEDHASNTQSNHGSGIPDLDCIDLGLETLSQDWNLNCLKRSFATGTMPDSGDGGDGTWTVDSGEDSNKEITVCLYSILVNMGIQWVRKLSQCLAILQRLK